jgi:tetratricopeptide (TPR) repeat protein
MPVLKTRLFSATTCAIGLNSRWKIWLFLLAVTVPAVWLGYWSLRGTVAIRLSGGDDFGRTQRAAELDPANPQIREKLGLIRLFAVREAQPAAAVKYFQQAIKLAPRRPGFRVDLASACDWSSDLDCSDAALTQALKLSPMVPRLEWITANHYVRTQRPDKAVVHLHRLLELDPDYAAPAFALGTRALGDPVLILTQVIPEQHEPDLKLGYIDFLSRQGQLGYAGEVWRKVVKSGGAFPFEKVQPYLERLLQAGQVGQAVNVWDDLKNLGIISVPREESVDNLVFNGNFAQPPLDAGFGWRSSRIPYVRTDFRDPSGTDHTPCLRVDYAVARNDDVEAAYQLVPVRPATTYTLSAQVRSEGITSDSGPRLRVEDPSCPACLDVQTEATLGTSPWHLVSLQFTSGDRTNLVRLSVWRPHSRTFPSEISGSFWIDAVSIKEGIQRGAKASAP